MSLLTVNGEATSVPRPAGQVPIELVAKAFLIRGVEQRLLDLFAEGKLFGTVHTCIGQEWVGVAVAEALREGDLVFSNHRCHGHYLARTDDVDGLLAEVMGKTTGMCGGRGGSQHICSQGFYSNGIQGGMLPVAAGMALAEKLRGKGKIGVIFIGDGTLGEGVVYETLNVLARWELPLLIVLENNHYAQSTPQSQNLAGDIGARAEAFGIKTARSNTWDVAKLLRNAAACVTEVRDSGRPLFLCVDTYRLMAHSKGDDHRDPAEVKAYRERDPLTRFAEEYPAEAERLQADVRRRIDAAVRRAEAAPYPVPRGPEPAAEAASPRWAPSRLETPDRAVTLLHAGLQRAMRQDERIILLGEDIEGPYGGAFKVTKNLSQEFPGRVRNTPISEAAILGLGNGLALSGRVPVCEIMFGDFLTLGFDQFVNHAAKFRYMYNDQVRVPLVVRTPMGGRRGYGATHSQSLEKHFLGVPDTLVLALNPRQDPGRVYDRLFAVIDRPTLVIENKLLYGTRVSASAADGFVLEESDEPFPTTRLRPLADPDVTVLCYGGMLPEVEAAAEQLFEEHDVVCEVICPVQLYPFNPAAVLESVVRTGRLVVAEEGQGFAAFGAEVLAQLAEARPGALRRCRRLAAPAHAIPCSGPLEKAVLPGSAHVIHTVRELLAND
jgi:2-oxoisovalerate dehydrogenase E1 component